MKCESGSFMLISIEQCQFHRDTKLFCNLSIIYKYQWYRWLVYKYYLFLKKNKITEIIYINALRRILQLSEIYVMCQIYFSFVCVSRVQDLFFSITYAFFKKINKLELYFFLMVSNSHNNFLLIMCILAVHLYI